MIKVDYHFDNKEVISIEYENKENLSKIDFLNKYLITNNSTVCLFGEHTQTTFINVNKINYLEIYQIEGELENENNK